MASVVVSDIPVDCNTTKLREYFEQEAGSIDSLSYLLHPLDGDPRQAIVAFRDSTVASYVAKCTHHIGDATLVVTSRPRDVFTQCMVQVDSLILVTCMSHIEQCLRAIEHDLGVQVKQSNGCVTLIGALAQIESAHFRLQKLWQHQVTRQERELEMINHESHDHVVQDHDSTRHQARDLDRLGQQRSRHQSGDPDPRGLVSSGSQSDDQRHRSMSPVGLWSGDQYSRDAGFFGDTMTSDTDRDRLRARPSAEVAEYSRLDDSSGSHDTWINRHHDDPDLRSVSPRTEVPFAASASCCRSMQEVLIRAMGGDAAFDNDDASTGQHHQYDTVPLGRTPSEVDWTTRESEDYLAGRCTGEISRKPMSLLVKEPSIATNGQDTALNGQFKDDDFHASCPKYHHDYSNSHKRADPLQWHSLCPPSEKKTAVPSITMLINHYIAAFIQKQHARELAAIQNDLHVTLKFEETGEETRIVISLPRPYDMLLHNLDMAQMRLFDGIVKSVQKERFYYSDNEIKLEEIITSVLCHYDSLEIHLVQRGELLIVGNHNQVCQAADMLKAIIDSESAIRYRSDEELIHRKSHNTMASGSGNRHDKRNRLNGNGHNASKSTDRVDVVAGEYFGRTPEWSSWKTSPSSKERSDKRTAISRQSSCRMGDGLHSRIPTKSWTSPPDDTKQPETPSGISHKPSLGLAKDAKQYQFSLRDDLNVVICDGDIVAEKVDVIVSAANGHLANYSGVASAISRAAGRRYERDCIDYVTKHGPLSVTSVVPMAVSGSLACHYVLHAVGPIWELYMNKDRCSADLRRTFYNCLCAADDLNATSMALPAISAGIFHVPTDICANSLLDALNQFVRERTSNRSLKMIHIVNLNSEVTELFAVILEQLLSVDGNTISRVDNSSSHSKCNSHGHGENDWRQGVNATIMTSSTESSPSGANGKTRAHRSLNNRVSVAKSSSKKSRNTSMDDDVEVSQHSSLRSRTSSMDRQKERDTTRRRTASLDRHRGGDMTCSQRDNSKLHPIESRGTEQISKTLRQTMSRSKTAPCAMPVRSSKTSRKKPIPDSPETSESEIEVAKPAVKELDRENCPICLDVMVLPKTLHKCGHRFCSRCIDAYFRHSKPVCPMCGMIYGVLKGDQPEGGMMSWRVDHSLRLPGFVNSVGAIVIKYSFPDGFQQGHHPNPGKPYSGIERKAYLPNNLEGREIVTLLRKAFDASLVFTIGDSNTTGRKDVITWNDIHHKTSTHGGSIGFGYPDSTYIQRVKEELSAKGITSHDIMKKLPHTSIRQC